MLFLVTWEFSDDSEAGQRRSLEVFGRWQPPERADFQAFYGFADGSGGCALIDVDSAATLAQTTAPFTPWLRFAAKPIVPIEDSAGIAASGMAFRDAASEREG